MSSLLQYAVGDLNNNDANKEGKLKKKGLDNVGFVGAAEELGMIERVGNNNNNNYKRKETILEDGPGKKMTLNKPLEVLRLHIYLSS